MVLVVEYDEVVMCELDMLIDVGLEVGVDGGRIVVVGSFEEVSNDL